nr:hypothetical protein Iba_chr14fCG6400 [Ipomoea batatas]
MDDESGSSFSGGNSLSSVGCTRCLQITSTLDLKAVGLGVLGWELIYLPETVWGFRPPLGPSLDDFSTTLEAKQMLALNRSREDEVTSSSVLWPSITPILVPLTLGGACALAFTCKFREVEDFGLMPRALRLTGAVPPNFPDVWAPDSGGRLPTGKNAAVAAVATMMELL